MKVDWYMAARCAMRNKRKRIGEIAAAMEAEQPDLPSPRTLAESVRDLRRADDGDPFNAGFNTALDDILEIV